MAQRRPGGVMPCPGAAPDAEAAANGCDEVCEPGQPQRAGPARAANPPPRAGGALSAGPGLPRPLPRRRLRL